jgi:hypothetical protein
MNTKVNFWCSKTITLSKKQANKSRLPQDDFRPRNKREKKKKKKKKEAVNIILAQKAYLESTSSACIYY